MAKENIIKSDVLVVGGGIAGCYAAMHAKEQGQDVILIDKSYATQSGSTPFPRGFMYFNPELGHKFEVWMNQVTAAGEYLNNRDWDETIIKNSASRLHELDSWGVKFFKDEKGNLLDNTPPSGGISAVQIEYGTIASALRKKLVQENIRTLDKIMITELIKQDGRVVGAVGFSTQDCEFFVLKAKATVICTGASSFKPFGFPISSVTGDGAAMAYRAGTEIIGKEFNDTHVTRVDSPAYLRYRHEVRIPGEPMEHPKIINAEGNEVPRNPSAAGSINMEFEAHAGRAPIYGTMPQEEPIAIVGGSGNGYGGAGEGIWMVDGNCASSVPGLYSAGESGGSMQIGAAYCGGGWGLPSAATTGLLAGQGAAAYAGTVKMPAVSEDEIRRLKAITLAPTERKGGFTYTWVTQVLQNAVMPYYVLYVKKEDRLNATLTLIEFMKDHLVPMMYARDPHDLRMAHETRNMVLNAEMKLRASLFRTESRGVHYREDYPRRDDSNWLAWVLLKEENGEMKTIKEPIPLEWRPDLSVPYEERYPGSFPGEERESNGAAPSSARLT